MTNPTTESSATMERLIDRVEEAVADPRYGPLKAMWTAHNRLQKQSKVPVSVFLHGSDTGTWRELIPPETLVSADPLERAIELQLRQKLYKHDHIPDDDVLLPTVWVRPVRTGGGPGEGNSFAALASNVNPVFRQNVSQDGTEDSRLWGLPFRRATTTGSGGAYKVVPVVTREADMKLLHHPTYQFDADKTCKLVERATEIVGGRLPVKIETDELGASPSETVVDLMGIEQLLYGVIDNPGFVHAMMDFVTDGYVEYHTQRGASRQIDPEESWKYRVHYEELPPEASSDGLAHSWAYFSAQSLSGLSPAMYEEFLQPYHARLAEILGDQRVYYHGCENLTRKTSVIRKLPNLRRFHVSPWSDLEAVVEELGGDFVLEAHSHPAETILVHSPEEMKRNLERMMAIGRGSVMDVNLSDIETVDGNPTLLTTWTEIAQELSTRFA